MRMVSKLSWRERPSQNGKKDFLSQTSSSLFPCPPPSPSPLSRVIFKSLLLRLSKYSTGSQISKMLKLIKSEHRIYSGIVSWSIRKTSRIWTFYVWFGLAIDLYQVLLSSFFLLLFSFLSLPYLFSFLSFFFFFFFFCRGGGGGVGARVPVLRGELSCHTATDRALAWG